MKKPKIKRPKINITNLHTLSMEERINIFNAIEDAFMKRFPRLKKELTFRNSRYEDIYTQKEEIVRLQFGIHKQNIMQGRFPKGTRMFLSNVLKLSTGNISKMVLEKAVESLDEYLDVIKGQSLEDYYEAVQIVENMSDEQKRRIVKERGFFINHEYDSEGRKEFETWIDDNQGDYRTDTIELYKLKYFIDHNTLTAQKTIKSMTPKKRERKKYRI